jgi:hypothetical protein
MKAMHVRNSDGTRSTWMEYKSCGAATTENGFKITSDVFMKQEHQGTFGD